MGDRTPDLGRSARCCRGFVQLNHTLVLLYIRLFPSTSTKILMSYFESRIFRPPQEDLRSAVVTMAATLASFATALTVRTQAHQGLTLVVLSVVLSLSLSRMPSQPEWHRAALTVLLVPLVAVGAGFVGQLLQHHFLVGAVVFIAVAVGSISMRQLGRIPAQVGVLLLLPLTSVLVVPAVGITTDAPHAQWWDAFVALAALGWVTLFRRIAVRGFMAPIPAVASAPTMATAKARFKGSGRMALQLSLTLCLAFIIGRHLFPSHWNWAVLTGIIVSGGGPARGEVVFRGATRLVGAGIGTLIATVVAAEMPGHHDDTVVLIFVVLFVGTWWRARHYAVWAACATGVMALLNNYLTTETGNLLATRLQAISIGAVCAVAISLLVFPVPTTNLARRRRANVLIALDHVVRGLNGPANDLGQRVAALHRRAAELQNTVRPLLVQDKLCGRFWPPDRDLLASITALLRCVAAAQHAATSLPHEAQGTAVGESAQLISDHIAQARRRLAGRVADDLAGLGAVEGALGPLGAAVLAI
jgi:uncharacterized membrane protein YccC